MIETHLVGIADALIRLRQEIVRKILDKRGLQPREDMISPQKLVDESMNDVLDEVLSVARPKQVTQGEILLPDGAPRRVKDEPRTDARSLDRSGALMAWRLIVIFILGALVALSVLGIGPFEDLQVYTLDAKVIALIFTACLLILSISHVLRFTRRSQFFVLLLLPLVALPYVLLPAYKPIFVIVCAPFWVSALLIIFLPKREMHTT